MPSLLQRVRRGSDTPQSTPTTSTTPTHRKRGSVDSQAQQSPTKGGFGKNVKNLFINDPQGGSINIKKRLSLSSPSAIFGKERSDSSSTRVSPTVLSSGQSSEPFTPNYSIALPMDTPTEERRGPVTLGADENQTRRLSQLPNPAPVASVAHSWPVLMPDSRTSMASERPSFSHDSGYGSVEKTTENREKPPGRPSPLSVDITSSPFAPDFAVASGRPASGASTPSRNAAPRPFIRPGLSGRQSSFNVMSSPPIPRPIANLPTLGSPSSAGPETPGWGWSTSTPSTPGGLSGFNTLLQNKMQAAQQNNPARTTELNEADVRKARRAMPVMLREPSVRPLPAEEGGEAGDDDDDDDEDSESEPEEVLDDSEDEEEHADVSPTPTPSRKGKGKAKSRMRANTMDAVREEEVGPSSPPGSPKALADRRKLPAPRLGSMPPSPPLTAPSASTWAMPTPKGGKTQTSWTQFQSMTPGATPKQPFVAMSSRGWTPQSIQTPSGDRESYFSSSTSTSSNQTPSVDLHAGSMLGEAAPVQDTPPTEDADSSAGSSDESHDGVEAPSRESAGPLATPEKPARPSLYSRPSRSMVDLASPNVETSKVNKGPGNIVMPAAGTSMSSGLPTPGDWAKPPPTPAVGSGPSPFFAKRKEAPSPLKRRRSMNDMSKPPPVYVIPDASSGFPQPREDEGKEKLPQYWCGVHIEGSLTRKMEFSSPGVQSRDRGWKKSYFILHGTSLYVYKHDPHKFPIRRADGSSVAVPDVGFKESAEFLHVHHPTERRASLIAPPPPVAPSARRGSVAESGQPRRASDASNNTRQSSSPEPAGGSRRSSVSTSVASSSSDAKDAALFNAPPRMVSTLPSIVSQQGSGSGSGSGVHLPFHNNALVKQYTLQNAESGLAADYIKKKNVVRVRAQGEQFLLQTEGAKDVVNWIEAFQAATNVALDLDARPMPKIITLPRRRRRRRPDDPPIPSDANPSTTDTPEGNAAAVAAAEAAARAATSDRMDSLIVEDQIAGL